MRDSKGLLRYSLEEPKGSHLRDFKEFLSKSLNPSGEFSKTPKGVQWARWDFRKTLKDSPEGFQNSSQGA